MPDDPATHGSLLLRIRNHRDSESWALFRELYAPLLFAFARQRGLQEADAADLTQTVLLKVARAIQAFHYDPQFGKFRSWLMTIARRELLSRWRKERHEPRGSGEPAMEELLERQPAREEEDWDQEYARRLFAWAAERVKNSVEARAWEAFWRTDVQREKNAEVASALGMSYQALASAKHRVKQKLIELIQQVEGN